MSVNLFRRFRQGAVMLFVFVLFISPVMAQPAHGVWDPVAKIWKGQGANTWTLTPRTGLDADSSGKFQQTQYYMNLNVGGFLEYLPNGFNDNPSQRYPIILYFPGCGEVHDGKMYVHNDGSPNYFYGLGRLFAQGGPPPVEIRYNASSEPFNIASYREANGQPWWSEKVDAYDGYLTPASWFTSDTFATNNTITGTTNTQIYQSGRKGSSFSYVIPRSNGNYKVRLHFAELELNAAGNTFSVTAEGVTQFPSVDIFDEAGGINRALVKEFDVFVGDLNLNLTFTGSTGDEAKISAIEITNILSGPTAGINFPALPTLLRDRGDYFSRIPLKTLGQNYPASGGPTMGAIVLALQYFGEPVICGNTPTLKDEDVMAVLEMLNRNYSDRIDYSRVYLTGMSWGGGVSYTFPASSLERARWLTAVAPVAAVNVVENAAGAQNVVNGGVSLLAVCNEYDFNTNGSGGNTIQKNKDAIALLNAENPAPGQINLHTFYKGSQVSPPDYSLQDPQREHNAWENAYRMEFLDTFRAIFRDPTPIAMGGVEEPYTMYEWFLLQQRVELFPVVLKEFTARRVGETALLEWITATESNSSYFTLERSTNGINFNEIGRVNSAGHSTSERKYNYTDDKLPNSTYVYYRLTQTDKDSKKQIFGIRKVYIGTNGFEVKVYPTITTGALILEVQGVSSDPLTLRIVDLSGKLLKQQVIAPRQSRVSLDVSGLAKGMYIIHTSNNVYQHTTKFVKQ